MPIISSQNFVQTWSPEMTDTAIQMTMMLKALIWVVTIIIGGFSLGAIGLLFRMVFRYIDTRGQKEKAETETFMSKERVRQCPYHITHDNMLKEHDEAIKHLRDRSVDKTDFEDKIQGFEDKLDKVQDRITKNNEMVIKEIGHLRTDIAEKLK